MTREIYYINTPSGTVAAIEIRPSQTTYFYIHTDLVGSFDVITNNLGVLCEKNCFDPWGRKRSFYDWSYNVANNTLLLGRGFTGHEHLDDFGLINMNGRVYDPILAMFLSPDNYVQAPGTTQGFNRYGYCLGNPLKYTDPDGEWFITWFVTLANLYINTSAANDWVFNPVKWDWGSPKTWISLFGSGFSGYCIGANFENRFKTNRYRKGYERVVKMDYIAIQETGSSQLPEDYDLYGFQKDYFPRYEFRREVLLSYNKEIVKAHQKEGELPSMAFTSNELVEGKYQIYFGEGAYKSLTHLYLSMGHEFIHVVHFKKFPSTFDLNMSEYAAYIWNAGYLHSRGDSGWKIFKDEALKWDNFNLSKNRSFLKIEPYLITQQNNYGLPFFNYFNLFN